MKRIPPAIQESQRYMKFKVRGSEKELGEVVDAVWKCCTEYMGVKDSSEADIRILGERFDEEEQTGVIRVDREKIEEVRAALTLRKGFKDNSFLSIEKVSGTLLGL